MVFGQTTQVSPPSDEKRGGVQSPFTTFQDAAKKRGLKVAIYGDYATGKTHFSLTAKSPIYIIDTEMGSAPLKANPAFIGKDIHVVSIFEPNESTLERDDVKSFEKMREAIDWVYKNVKEGTLVVDSVTDLWKMCQTYAKVNIFKLRPEQRFEQMFDWGIPNNLHQQLILKMLDMPLDVIFTARAAQTYAGAGKPTGVYSPQWQKQLPFYVDVVVENTKAYDKTDGACFQSALKKCRFGKKYINKKFKNLTIDTLKEEIASHL